VGKIGQFVLTGLIAGAILGWLLSLVSGNWWVIVGVAVVGTVIGTILGIVHRNDA